MKFREYLKETAVKDIIKHPNEKDNIFTKLNNYIFQQMFAKKKIDIDKAKKIVVVHIKKGIHPLNTFWDKLEWIKKPNSIAMKDIYNELKTDL